MNIEVYYSEVNLICIVILFLLLVSLPRGNFQNKKGIIFKILLILTCLFCLFDLLAGVLRGKMFGGARELLWISNIFYPVFMLLISFTWVLYCVAAMPKRINKIVVIILGSLIGIAILMNLLTPLTGLMFTIDENNLYARGGWLWLNWVVSYACEIIPSIYAFRAKIEKREKLAIVLFPLLPMIAGAIQFLFYGLTVGQAGMTATLVLIYVMLHSMEVNETRLKVKLYDELSRSDTLTGINNRRSYDIKLEELKDSEWVGVIFMDMNGLKETNDTFGHKAGDELICRFAETIKRYYREDEMYRISGDEFVILTNEQETFNQRLKEFNIDKGDLAALGAKTGPGGDVLELIKEAENGMYEDKMKYYIRTGKDRRK